MSGSNSNAPPPPQIEIEPFGTSPGLTGGALTDWPDLLIVGTAKPGDGDVTVLINGSEDSAPVATDGTFDIYSFTTIGVQTIKAVQIDSAGTSAPSNAITLYDTPTPVEVYNGETAELASPVNLSYVQFESLVAQGLQLDLFSPTQILQFTDGEYDTATGNFIQQSADPFSSNANATPPPLQIAIEPVDDPPALTGSVFTNWPITDVTGTAVIGDGAVEILVDGTQAGPEFLTYGSYDVAVFPGTGLHTITAVQIDAAGTSAVSNAVTVYVAGSPTQMNGVETSTVDLSYAQYQSLIAQGIQVDLFPVQALQFTDGTYDVSTNTSTFTASGDSSTMVGLSGADTVNLTGTGNTVNIYGPTVVNLGNGANTINAATGAATIFGGSGSLDTTIGQSGAATVFLYAGNTPSESVVLEKGGTGGSTLVGGANNVMIFQNANKGTGAMFVAGAGNETLFGASSQSNDQYWGSFSGGSDMMFAGSGTDILVAGGGAQTMVGGAGADVFYAINANAISATTGNPVAPGRYTVFSVHAGDILALTGYDSLYGAAGSHAAAAAVSSALASGSAVVALADGSTIDFVGPTKGLLVLSS